MKRVVFLLIGLSLVGLVIYRVYDAYKAKAEAPPGGNPRGGGGGPGGGGRGGGMNPAFMRVPLVDTALVSEGSLDDKVALVGSLRPIAEIQVMSKIAGRVEKVLVDVGDSIRPGHLIATVEDREIQQQIAEAEASLGVVRASIKQREAELSNVDRQVSRYRELHEQNLISRQELDDLLTRQQSNQAQVELSKAQLRQGEASVDQLKINLDNTRINAPMDGFVGKRFIHPGALVNANTPIISLVDLRSLRMVVNMVERDIVRVNRGVVAQISVDAFPGRLFPGRVLRVSPVMDPATRTGEVEVHVNNPQLNLRAEMFARVTLDMGGQRRGLLVPREAMVYRGEQSGVFVLNGNVAQFRPVEPGLTQQNQVEIMNGVKAGEKVVTMGASLLKDGDEVRLRGEGPSGGKKRGEGGGPPQTGQGRS